MLNLRSSTLLSAILALTGLAAAQGGATGAISGTVNDVTGAAVAGAQVQIINQDTGAVARTLKTDASGEFTAPLLPVATYTVKVTGQQGFTSSVQLQVENAAGSATLPSNEFRPIMVSPGKGSAQSTLKIVTNGNTPTGTFANGSPAMLGRVPRGPGALA